MGWDFDLVIVGGGGAGLAAAIEAKRAGASCIVLEADKKLGGATVLSAGVFYAAGTSVQRSRGIVDGPDRMFEYITNLNQWELKPSLVRLYCDLSAPTLEWLIALGASFPPEYLVIGGSDLVPRAHSSQGIGTTVGETLINAAGAEGVEVALDTRVERLLVEDGRVVGVRASGLDLRAPHTLVATGGFGNNPEMIRRLLPTAAYHGDRTFAIHERAPFILGDGITMAEAVGAEIVGYDRAALIPITDHVRRGLVQTGWLPPFVMLVNKEGRRFMREDAAYSYSGNLVNQQTDKVSYALFDELVLSQMGTNTKYFDPYHADVATPSWEEGLIRRLADEGRLARASSIAELAERIGIDPVALETSVAKYNADFDGGMDSDFLKKSEDFCALRTPPFYATEIRACMISNTNAGLNIDTQCRVLDSYQRPIPGLYAAGEVLGCIQGTHYAAGGVAIGAAVCFGRRVGQAVGAEVSGGSGETAVSPDRQTSHPTASMDS